MCVYMYVYVCVYIYIYVYITCNTISQRGSQRFVACSETRQKHKFATRNTQLMSRNLKMPKHNNCKGIASRRIRTTQRRRDP